MARGRVRDDHPLCFGYADPSLNRAAHSAFQEADLFLILGKRIDYRLALGGPRVSVSGCEMHPGRHSCAGTRHEPRARRRHPRRRKEALCRHCAIRSRSRRLASPPLARTTEKPARRLAATTASKRELDRSQPMHPAAFYAELRKALPPDTSVRLGWRRFCPLGSRSDAGIATRWLASPRTARRPSAPPFPMASL